MALPSCPDCGSVDLDLRETLPDTRRHLVCGECDHDWLYGEAAVAPEPVDSLARARGRFPTPDAVPSATRDRSLELKARFLDQHPAPGEAVAPYWVKYQQVFSADGLPVCDPKDLKDFANTTTGAHPGNMSVSTPLGTSSGHRLQRTVCAPPSNISCAAQSRSQKRTGSRI